MVLILVFVADAFSYELMCQGKEKLNYYMNDYRKRSDSLTNKEQDTLKDMKLVQEMYPADWSLCLLIYIVQKQKIFRLSTES